MTFAELVKTVNGGGAGDFQPSEKTKALLAELERSTAKDEEAARNAAKVAETVNTVKEALTALAGLELPSGGLLVNLDAEGKLQVTLVKPPKPTKGGNGKAFGGGGPKVKGPFVDTQTGAIYKNWHAVAVGVLGHTCKPGFETETGSSRCGYWTKELVALRDGGRFVPQAQYTPQGPAPEATPASHAQAEAGVAPGALQPEVTPAPEAGTSTTEVKAAKRGKKAKKQADTTQVSE